MPDTGVVRRYDWTVQRKVMAPDGVVKEGIFINGQYPGPLLEANWGDWVEVTVRNGLDDEGTTIHWHGLLLKETPWYDGVLGIAQCPIAPGKTFTYRFRADQYGTSWYHSHYSAQYSDGVFGPMIIYGPNHVKYDIDIGPVILEDWYHADYYSLVQKTMAGRFPPSNNNLINGRMNYPCANATLPCVPNAGVSKFRFQSGKTYRLRLINPSADAFIKYKIDGHNMTVIANDFKPVVPYSAPLVNLAVGQRSDIIVLSTALPWSILMMIRLNAIPWRRVVIRWLLDTSWLCRHHVKRQGNLR